MHKGRHTELNCTYVCRKSLLQAILVIKGYETLIENWLASCIAISLTAHHFIKPTTEMYPSSGVLCIILLLLLFGSHSHVIKKIFYIFNKTCTNYLITNTTIVTLLLEKKTTFY